MIITPKFEIGQTVFHATPESDTGIVIEWNYSHRERSITYQVAFGPGQEARFYYEEELSETKKFN